MYIFPKMFNCLYWRLSPISNPMAWMINKIVFSLSTSVTSDLEKDRRGSELQVGIDFHQKGFQLR